MTPYKSRLTHFTPDEYRAAANTLAVRFANERTMILAECRAQLISAANRTPEDAPLFYVEDSAWFGISQSRTGHIDRDLKKATLRFLTHELAMILGENRERANNSNGNPFGENR